MIDIAWILTCAALVFMMQAGFCCLESGYVRSKNSVNVAAKNFSDFCISAALFWFIGFGIMFGTSHAGLFGTDGFGYAADQEARHAAFFIFQVMFCGAATTIVSGAIAERSRFVGYLAISCVIAVVIYPVFGHWAWAGADGGGDGWLAQIGFVDFAGATVVHSIAGWVSLAAVLIIGPRVGRFDGTGGSFRSYSLPMSALGVFIIWVGWIGFNGGSTFAADESISLIILNTLVAGAFGGLGAMVISPLLMGRQDVPSMMNGGLAGLVAITATAHAVAPASAVFIGFVGGVISVIASRILYKLKIDDVLSAFPVHGVSGIWGTIAVAIFADLAILDTGLSRPAQFVAQSIGVVVASLWAFGAGFLILWAINKVMPLRVHAEAERIGLNISEHAQSTEQLDLLRAMEIQRLTGDYSRAIPVEPNSEVGDIAAQYNLVLRNLYSAKQDAETANNAKSDFLASMSHELRTPLNAIMGFSEMISREYFGPVGSKKYQEYADDITNSSKHLLSLVDDILDLSKIEAGKNALTKTDIDVKSIFDSCLKIATGAIDCSQIYLEIRVTPGLAPLHADERALRQVILNLLFNAVKFTPGGGHVTMTAAIRDNHHIIEVSDTGGGIPADEIAKITEPFAQLETQPHIAKLGTGLGLSIAKALVEAHDGVLTIDSHWGHGTTVRLEFPNTAA